MRADREVVMRDEPQPPPRLRRQGSHPVTSTRSRNPVSTGKSPREKSALGAGCRVGALASGHVTRRDVRDRLHRQAVEGTSRRTSSAQVGRAEACSRSAHPRWKMTPAQRVIRARLRGFSKSALHNGRDGTAKARARFLQRFEDEARRLAPDASEAEIARRAEALRIRHTWRALRSRLPALDLEPIHRRKVLVRLYRSLARQRPAVGLHDPRRPPAAE